MAHTHSRNVSLPFVIFCMGMFFCNPAVAKEKPWYKYENSHFEAYSNENERVTRKLLLKLENFRAAVLQVADIEVPAGTPKTQVVIFASEKKFHKLIGDHSIGGFAYIENGVPTMVLPAGTYSDFTEMVLRHEYAHVLMTYKGIRYPTWFNEGFAELLSAITFRKKGSVIALGQSTIRSRNSERLAPWSRIISDDFSPHTIGDPGRASDAYLQSWFLTHYFMLGNNSQNAIQLATYISLLLDGQESVAAFETVVGMSTEEFGDKVLRRYFPKYVTVNVNPSKTDHDFQRNEVASDEILPLIEQYRDRFAND